VTETADLARLTPIEAAKLDRRQFRRYLQAVETESALQRGEPPPSALGRLFKPAATERKLVLFTLGIIVILLIVAVFVIEMWSDGDTSVTTPLVTLAGTGLGFIGGMVADRRPTSPKEDERRPGTAPSTPGGQGAVTRGEPGDSV
jgi:hypothetical protein